MKSLFAKTDKSIFYIFEIRQLSYSKKLYLSNDILLIIYKGIFLKLWSKVATTKKTYYLHCYSWSQISPFDPKYFSLTKLDLSGFFSNKLFIWTWAIVACHTLSVSQESNENGRRLGSCGYYANECRKINIPLWHVNSYHCAPQSHVHINCAHKNNILIT